MIGFLRGKVLISSLSKVLIDVSGVGYSVHTMPKTVEKLRTGMEASLYIYTAVRENDISLYGFEKEDELRMFENLLNVSGIGPKSALTVLGVAGVGAIEEAVISGNTAVLTKIAGIGKKTADKIVLELSGKIATSDSLSAVAQADLDLFEALRSLGYKDGDIQSVLKLVPQDLTSTSERLTFALRNLGKKN
jgi:Holliday junction DNA helicase RuvA